MQKVSLTEGSYLVAWPVQWWVSFLDFTWSVFRLLRWRVLVPKIQINRVKWPFKIISDMELLSSGICLPIILLLLPVKKCFVKLTKCLTLIYVQEPGSTENNRTKLITSSVVTSPFSKMWQRGWRILIW